jgi:hypothetical protein
MDGIFPVRMLVTTSSSSNNITTNPGRKSTCHKVTNVNICGSPFQRTRKPVALWLRLGCFNCTEYVESNGRMIVNSKK